MKLKELIKRFIDFKQQVSDFRKLLLKSRGDVAPDIIKNHKEIEEMRSMLNNNYGKLEKYIIALGNSPIMKDGIDVYSAYQNAFADDTLLRVGPSLRTVIQDLDYILGKLEGLSEREFRKIIHQAKEKHNISENKPKANYWLYTSPLWLIWRLAFIAWKYRVKLILGIGIGLIVAYLVYRFGWNK